MSEEKKRDGVPRILKALVGAFAGAMFGVGLGALIAYLFSLTGIASIIAFSAGVIVGAVLGFIFHEIAGGLLQLFQ